MKTRLKLLIFFVVMWFIYPLLFSQQIDTLYIRKGENGRIVFARFAVNENTDRKISNATNFLKTILNAKTEDEFRLISTLTDKIGISHKKYQQYYKGYKVEGAEYSVHGKDDIIEVINGNYQEVNIENLIPIIEAEQAFAQALVYVNAEKYKWDVFINENIFSHSELVIAENHVEGENPFRLSWKFYISSIEPDNERIIFVDAINGKVIQDISLVFNSNTSGYAQTKYSDGQNIICDSYPQGYRLYETKNTVLNKSLIIHTFNIQNRVYEPYLIEFTNTNTNWKSGNWVDFNRDQAALDVHWGSEKIIDYWNSVHFRNGIHDTVNIISYAHYGRNFNNASYNSSTHVLKYGDGDSTTYSPFTSLDIVAHEIGHGVAWHTANFRSSIFTPREAGALNEGFSDIWGVCVKYWVTSSKPLWKTSSEIILDPNYNCIRDIQNPKSVFSTYGPCPNTYMGEFWDITNYDPHKNSTVLSHCFYLLCEGGSGINDNGNSFNVVGIGIKKAQHIAYSALAYYLQSFSNFHDARDAFIQAAIDLYGDCSPEVISVSSAWYAVGVGNNITSNTTWSNNSYFVSECVTINSGFTLTITGNVYCSSSATFVVKPGGRLIVDGGTITNACPNMMWQGITVLGGTLQNHGIVQVINNGKIENAQCAVTLNENATVYAYNANFVNNTMGVFFKPSAGSGNFIKTNFELNDNYFGETGPGSFGDTRDFISHLRMYSSGNVLIEGCNFSSTAHPLATNCGIEAMNTNVTIKEICPLNCPLFSCIGCPSFCNEKCMIKTRFSGFSLAVSGRNFGTLAHLKVRFTIFEDNYTGAIFSVANYLELLKNEFNISKNGAYGLNVAYCTGYKIEENTFTDKFPALGRSTVGSYISNSGTAENEIYKNTYIGLNEAQCFSGTNSSQKDTLCKGNPRDISPGNPQVYASTGLQTLCNEFKNSQSRDIQIGIVNSGYNMNSIRKNQGNLLSPAGNMFYDHPAINIDNTLSQHNLNYYYDVNKPNSCPNIVSSNVTLIPATASNGCPSKIFGSGGGGQQIKEGGKMDLEKALAQYDEWNEQYNYWLAKAKEVCGEEGEGNKEKGEGENEVCSLILDRVSYYSALKDNYFNAIIVAVMNSYELRVTSYDTLRFLFNYRGQYQDYLSIVETFLAESNFTEASATLSTMFKKFKLNDEQVNELTGLQVYTRWLQQLEEKESNIYKLSENEIEYLVNFVETHIGRGVLFANNILCALYDICKEDETMRGFKDEMINGERRREKGESEKEDSYGLMVLRSYGLEIFPNPGKDYITVASEIEDCYFELINAVGVVVKSEKLNRGSNTINTSSLPQGIYIYRAGTGEKTVTGKWVKN